MHGLKHVGAPHTGHTGYCDGGPDFRPVPRPAKPPGRDYSTLIPHRTDTRAARATGREVETRCHPHRTARAARRGRTTLDGATGIYTARRGGTLYR